MQADNPLSVICPSCNASVGAKCTKKVRDGSVFVDEFHQERIELSIATNSKEKSDNL